MTQSTKTLFSKTIKTTVGVTNTSGTFKFNTEHLADVLYTHFFGKDTFKTASAKMNLDDQKRLHGIIGRLYQEIAAFESSRVIFDNEELRNQARLMGKTDDMDDLDRTNGFRVWFRTDEQETWQTFIQLSSKTITEVYQIIKQIDQIEVENPIRELFFDAIVDYFVPTF